MREPHRQELGVESEAVGGGVRDAREVLEADEGRGAPVDDEFAGIRGADPDHQDDVDGDVEFEGLDAGGLGARGEGGDIEAGEEIVEITTIGAHGVPHHFVEVRPCGLDDVVVPIRAKEPAVGLEVAVVPGDGISTRDGVEELGYEIDQHGPKNTASRESGQGHVTVGKACHTTPRDVSRPTSVVRSTSHRVRRAANPVPLILCR